MRVTKKWVTEVERVRGVFESRYGFLRLEKNEKISYLPDKFFEIFYERLKPDHFSAYPETEFLYDKIANYLGVDRKQILLTAGSDAGIKTCFDLCVSAGDQVITLSPTFAMIDVYCKLFGAKQLQICYDQSLTLDFHGLLNAINKQTSLLVIANPNSPTGTLIDSEKIEIILNKACECDVVTLIDEAYYEFCKTSAIGLLNVYPNLIISRTFSKAMGLAGCRVGYLVTQELLAQMLYKFRPMYEVNQLGVMAADIILDNMEWVDDYCLEVEAGKVFLFSKLDKLKKRYIDTKTNFSHVDMGCQKEQFISHLLNQKIIVKGGPGVIGFEEYLRITLGPQNRLALV